MMGTTIIDLMPSVLDDDRFLRGDGSSDFGVFLQIEAQVFHGRVLECGYDLRGPAVPALHAQDGAAGHRNHLAQLLHDIEENLPGVQGGGKEIRKVGYRLHVPLLLKKLLKVLGPLADNLELHVKIIGLVRGVEVVLHPVVHGGLQAPSDVPSSHRGDDRVGERSRIEGLEARRALHDEGRGEMLLCLLSQFLDIGEECGPVELVALEIATEKFQRLPVLVIYVNKPLHEIELYH
jgi:hypothetical protein